MSSDTKNNLLPGERNGQPKNKLGIPLPVVLIVPFIIQIFAAVGITGYLSFRNGQKAVRDLATDLQSEAGDRVSLHLDNYRNCLGRLK